MTSYLDTTILVAVSEEVEPTNTASLASIAKHPPKCVAHYAYRELLAGRIGLLCDLQNHVVASQNIVEVAIGFHRKSGFGRTPRAKVGEILERLAAAFEAETLSPQDEKRRIAEDLSLLANRAWRKAQRFSSSSERHQPLACFELGSLSVDEHGLISGPKNSFDCDKQVECSAARYLYQDKVQLQKMIDALAPEALPEKLRTKSEIVARRKALKRLLDKGPSDFPHSFCRKIGDAYFAQTCPPGAHVLTTNAVDFVPLCEALNKSVLVP